MNTTIEAIEAEIEHQICYATLVDPVGQLVAKLTEGHNSRRYDPIQNVAKWNLEGLIELEVKKNLWLAVEVTRTDLGSGHVEAFVRFFAETLERVAFGFAEDTSSGRSNDAARVAAEATRGWVRDNRYLNKRAVELLAAVKAFEVGMVAMDAYDASIG